MRLSGRLVTKSRFKALAWHACS
uniref:Uncharacterized protein n=1 Tax=Arundo donax TaxID=35708 RepID=A0A0A9HA80_ARUDO